ncbi:uncharacterized protein VP01_6413g1 [Puccinia sorghi]|uniref:Uncharacterized protein n=1 Tax=Puccinia sorghi TaxID=27349 RepID=A0A0L6UFU2_9BASI|nr:uncharacterized protein VP01_6413g1 [Puccinia sorghi]
MSAHSMMEHSRETHQIPDSDLKYSDCGPHVKCTNQFNSATVLFSVGSSNSHPLLDLSELDEKPMRPKPVSTLESHFSHPISGPQLPQSCMTPCNPQPSLKSNQVAAAVWFSLIGICFPWKSKSDGAMMAEMVLKAFQKIDTCTWKATKFCEIMHPSSIC